MVIQLTMSSLDFWATQAQGRCNRTVNKDM
jgi:hypothetical protein